MTRAWLLADNKNKNLIAQVVAKVMQFDTASQNDNRIIVNTMIDIWNEYSCNISILNREDGQNELQNWCFIQ